MAIPARQSRPSLEQLLDVEQVEYDGIMAGVRGGIRSASHYDELEERADAHCRAVRAAFRECRR